MRLVWVSGGVLMLLAAAVVYAIMNRLPYDMNYIALWATLFFFATFLFIVGVFTTGIALVVKKEDGGSS